MSDARYYIVGDHDVWMIKFEDGEYGPCASRDEAVVFAIDAAQRLELVRGTPGRCPAMELRVHDRSRSEPVR